MKMRRKVLRHITAAWGTAAMQKKRHFSARCQFLPIIDPVLFDNFSDSRLFSYLSFLQADDCTKISSLSPGKTM